ncbi:NAD(P)-dependent dehydrogenase (short-subunit alcohol dehydrogenase family) [Chitinophaga polysaccharea]|uniref:NAD(P)-dependent dehydrogenase (Short-subunit alcohol dehydrogenase family) n=1 Tax=Chitinophaga polysaccharea TaxID=1293035 RepID=A0A561PR25_9BACT|nr:SDR family oxidoreductase [Chitinophaga polysaccharea]TWF40555.1 NAD(P)-dependent dehydrogenase (short-subunit alcohol dehydrogenase family) [Chitinophaga polysaccharea]
MILKNKIIVITGGAAGIGEACVQAYIREGATVAVIDKTPATLSAPHLFLLADLNEGSAIQQAITTIRQTYGRIDAIHNNAGIASPSKPLHETGEAEWEQVMNVNVRGIYYTTRYGIEALKASRGCILNTSSMVGEIGQENHAAYAGSKGAVNALTKAMALDYAKDGIRVNAVAPAGVWTPMLRQWRLEQPNPGHIEQYLNNIHALGYCPEASVIADVCAFLLSDNARFITGAIMPVSGGAELGYKHSL